jgi:Holliday junction resolvasome RuvABC endonuclease subunit
MNCLALDMATHMGWAAGDLAGQPTWGSEVLGPSGATQGQRFLQAFISVQKVISQVKPDLVVIEAAIPAGAAGGAARSQMAMGYRAIVHALAFKVNLPVEERYVATIRAYFIGRGGRGGEQAKIETVQQCTRLGWHTENDNEADALALWDLIGSEKGLRQTAPLGGLFQ